ncbi:eotaxin-like [Rhinoraja longicauda]
MQRAPCSLTLERLFAESSVLPISWNAGIMQWFAGAMSMWILGTSRRPLISGLTLPLPFKRLRECKLLSHRAPASTSIQRSTMKAALCVVALVGALVICTFQNVAAAPPGSITLECCETFKTTPIRHRRLKSYRAAPWCSTPTVIFVNRRNMKICTRAGERWVKVAMNYLDRKNKKA